LLPGDGQRRADGVPRGRDPRRTGGSGGSSVTINFGVLPVRCSFTLSRDADFYQTVTTSDGENFPNDTTMSIKFYDDEDTVLATWTASITGNMATFHEDKEDVAEVLDDEPVQGRLHYQGGLTAPELVLAQGAIHDVSP